ncbi:MAG: OFA family MFS transporter [Oscillospiraceae bacterium]|nr:OFA family MFS transporter [Oscillospiraceae bacterium]
MPNYLNNKWIRGVLPALFIHLSIGSVYAFSLLSKPIADYIGRTQSSVQFAFSLAIFFLGTSAAFGGNIVEKNIRRSSLLSMFFFISGLIITGISVYLKSLLGVYIGYGCIMGIGLGIGYLTPVKTLMLWFSEHRGLATGIAVCSFGFGSALATPIINKLITTLPVYQVFWGLAGVYALPMLLSHWLIRKPHVAVAHSESNDFKLKELLKNPTFICIWLMVYINIGCGLAVIPNAVSILSSYNVGKVALTVGIMGIFNGAGRLIFSAVSDKFPKREVIYYLIFTLSFIACIIGMIFKTCLPITLVVVSACYGAGFSCLPSLLSDRFGMNNISKIHGWSLTAWALAGLTGNQMANLINGKTGSYTPVFIVISALYLIGLFISLRIKEKN